MFKIKREDLAEVLSALSAAWRSDPNDTDIGKITLKGDGESRITMFSSCHQLGVKATLNIEHDEEFNHCIVGTRLPGWLALQRDVESVTVKMRDDKITFNAGRTRMNMSLVSTMSTAAMVVPESDPDDIVDGETLAYAMRYLSKTIKNPLIGQALRRSTLMRTVNDKTHVVSTDGVHLGVSKIDSDPEFQLDVVVDTDMLTICSKIHEGPVKVYESNMLILVSDRYMTRVPMININFPPYNRILDIPVPDGFKVDKKALSLAAKSIYTGSGPNAEAKVKLEEGKLSMRTRPGTQDSDGELVEVEVEVDQNEFRDLDLNIKVRDFLDAVDASEGEKLEISLPDSDQFILVKDDRSWVQLFTVVSE